ncbi:aldehyde dehydrogenase family protein [Corallococcus sp. AS-1-12]|uniref:aldehyde dehydrogenase family protein n=1 Tax=Corallococcus sp. AS-1-12 TaxID=2874598 RepID=UPI001CC127A5|nr:aldehyde dehydrogenase family protein [Corallococcus sp. AS-1-12]MBZ4335926.1 aldehyde dehydrogenase family protein [Corallococcus sp. AS-1-12]
MAEPQLLSMDNLRSLIAHALANPPYSATAKEVEALVRAEAALRDQSTRATAPQEKVELLKAAEEIRQHRDNG